MHGLKDIEINEAIRGITNQLSDIDIQLVDNDLMLNASDGASAINLTQLVKQKKLIELNSALPMNGFSPSDDTSVLSLAVIDGMQAQQNLAKSAKHSIDEIVAYGAFCYMIEDCCDNTKAALQAEGLTFSGAVGAENKIVQAIYDAFNDRSIDFQTLALKDAGKSKEKSIEVLNQPVVDKLQSLLLDNINGSGVTVIQQSTQQALSQLREAKLSKEIEQVAAKQIEEKPEAVIAEPEPEQPEEMTPEFASEAITKKIEAKKEAMKPYDGKDAVPYVADYSNDADTRRHLMSFLKVININEAGNESVLEAAKQMRENNVFIVNDPAGVSFSNKDPAQDETVLQLSDMIEDVTYELMLEDRSITKAQGASRIMKAMEENGLQCVVLHSPKWEQTNQPLALKEANVTISPHVIDKISEQEMTNSVKMQGYRY